MNVEEMERHVKTAHERPDPPDTLVRAYLAGKHYARAGATMENCHHLHFRDKLHTRAWEMGRNDGRTT